MELQTVPKQKNPGQSVQLALESKAQQTQTIGRADSFCNIDVGCSRSRLGSSFSEHQLGTNGCEQIDLGMASLKQQLTRDGSSPNGYQELQTDNNRTEHRVSNATNRQSNCRVRAEEVENLNHLSSPSTHDLSDIGLTKDTIGRNSHSRDLWSQGGFTQQTLQEMGLLNQRVDLPLDNELPTVHTTTRSLRQQNKQKMFLILLNISGPTRRRKARNIYGELDKSKSPPAPSNRTYPQSPQKTQEITVNCSLLPTQL
ncbi:MAG: hypothetical protein EZS28_051419, partial [Streblomastix strix]